MKPIRRVAVLGAGTMGARIAAHFANAGVPSDLLDLTLDAAKAGLESVHKLRPAGFFTPETARLVAPGSFDEHLGRAASADWIVEAVTENLDIKRALYARLLPLRAPGAILSTNTSGIPLARISEGWPSEVRRHFLGTHFFNPPRYMHLVEVIPGAETAPEILAFASEYCDRRLGKGVAPCKDTPNFIANRIGSFFGATIHKLAVEGDYTVEEVDALTGPLVGLPKSASFRLLDIIGVDVWGFVTKNLYDMVPDDPWRDRFVLPPFFGELLQRRWLGDKTGQGMYKRVGPSKEIHALDWKTFEYHPAQKPKFPSVEAVKPIEDLPQRLRALIAGQDRAGAFLWPLFRDHCIYAAAMVPEISDRIVEIDRAMRWGYAHALGPFELWDALGVPDTVARMQAEKVALPESVERMLASGANSFYRAADRDRRPRTEYFDLCAGAYREIETRPGVISLPEWKRAGGVVRSNSGASLIDLGDGALCLEFHSKMNALGDDAMNLLLAGLDETARNFEALVIANQGEHFSAGANLMMVLLAAQEGEWDELDAAVRRFQNANQAIKYAVKPVVAAPFGLTLGGGCEVVLHAARAQASAETYMGLVEVGVGVIPAGGGCKEMLARGADLKTLFELIGFAKTSASAADAKKLGLLRPDDGVSMNRERVVADAKDAALALARAYAAPTPAPVRVEGEAGIALLKTGIYIAREGGYISGYDALIGEKLAHILAGGRLSAPQEVSEQYLLDLEREAFLSLCGNRQTQDRIQHMLKTGKPLRN